MYVCVLLYEREEEEEENEDSPIEEMGELFNMNVCLHNFCFCRHRRCPCM